MQIGALNKEIIIQDKTQVSDNMGGFTDTWGNLYTLFSAIWPVSSKEQISSMQLSMTISHRIRIRYRTGISASYRVKFGSRYFSIVSIINPNERNQWLDLVCREAQS